MNKLSRNTLEKQGDLIGWLVKVISPTGGEWYKVIVDQNKFGDIRGSYGYTEEAAIESYQGMYDYGWAIGDRSLEISCIDINKINQYKIVPIRKIF